MAVWLSMSMSYVGVGDSANTSKIIVSVDVSWDYPHFNRDGGTLKVTVDGVTDTRIVPFNAGETSSGSQNIYSYYWNIAQHDGATKTVSASATFQATSSTAATPASTTLSLPAIGDSSGGGDSGDSGGDDDDEGGNTGGGSGGTTNPDILVHPDTNCTYLGTSFSADSGYGNESFVMYDAHPWYIKFKTPADLTSSSSVTVRFTNFYVKNGYDKDLSLSLFEGSPNGKEAMASVNCWPSEADIVHSSYDVIIPTTELKKDTEYTVMLNAYAVLMEVDAPVGIIIDYIAVQKRKKQCYISSESSNDPYVVHIDNGTTWDEYEAHIDNGTSWDLYG